MIWNQAFLSFPFLLKSECLRPSLSTETPIPDGEKWKKEQKKRNINVKKWKTTQDMKKIIKSIINIAVSLKNSPLLNLFLRLDWCNYSSTAKRLGTVYKYENQNCFHYKYFGRTCQLFLLLYHQIKKQFTSILLNLQGGDLLVFARVQSAKATLLHDAILFRSIIK